MDHPGARRCCDGWREEQDESFTILSIECREVTERPCLAVGDFFAVRISVSEASEAAFILES
jgi:hypothetical protein